MKDKHRYLLFYYQDYYPNGGWDDLYSSSDDLEKLKKICEDSVFSEGFMEGEFQIVDLETREIIFKAVINNLGIPAILKWVDVD